MLSRYKLVLLLFSAILTVTAGAQVIRSDFQSLARSTCTPLPMCAIPQRGTITCPSGGEASPSLMPPWCSDGRTKVRDRMLMYSIVNSTDDRVSGNVTFVLNANMESATFSGPIWGSYVIEVPERGRWEGHWEGTAETARLWTYKVVLFGSGEFEGLQLRADGVWQLGIGDMLRGTIKALPKSE